MQLQKKTLQRLFFYPLVIIIASFFFKDRLIAALFEHNGFDLSNSLVDVSAIHHGGPAKDGIPALDRPVFIKVEAADFLQKEDRVLALQLHGISKAYPIKILNYHEIVNDSIAGQAIAITYCPLCGSGVAYKAEVQGKKVTFGVSGLLYNSDVLLYDRESESLWSQLLSSAISGKQAGKKLERLPLSHTTWEAWSKKHPETLVLSTQTGYSRHYARNPYGNYHQSPSLYFPVNTLNKAYHPKEYVLGLEIQGKFKVYPFAELSQQKSPISDTFAGEKIKILFDPKYRTAKVINSHQEEVPGIIAFWFAWMAFYPHSEVFKATHTKPNE